jgi:hypothetical protein
VEWKREGKRVRSEVEETPKIARDSVLRESR